MRILSLITHFPHIATWEKNTDRIDIIDPLWSKRSLIGKAFKLARLAPGWDKIVFFYDLRLPILTWLFYAVLHRKSLRPRIIFTTWLCDFSTLQANGNLARIPYNFLRRLSYLIFVRVCYCIVVHSSEEVRLYATAFGVQPAVFKFIPYCVRADALTTPGITPPIQEPYILAAGRHRDFDTFIEATRNLKFQVVIIAGATDREHLNSYPSASNISILFEIPFMEYRGWISHASLFVVPLQKLEPSRSLGQIATFEAVIQQVPVVAARTFHLCDYFGEDEVTFYEAGNAEELRGKISQLMTDAQLRQATSAKAYNRLSTNYTDEIYVKKLLQVCYDG